ncbi:MAG: excinuclease ABC subunit B [Candidatus Margulisiibacteriota bacterium]|nr:MAG: excinuclease ABC subunit B [Candidatus Margulisbacteria bacterium GWF2_38_17]OGI11668.1 MAG: excinuclease ABC subunit B [Candidatus Margulisbacteria bacterium GWE2_39_32]PZM83786.1 MAG: excinuclease ABC subunit B [Candidatus Margulisiibacteriota bacterium]HCT86265.1 excinuclease ABC subunit B [Candidatus Margulisiibacteriota bacterium]HCY36727.1 excinuclease ABC subunit B [Candidatus Margulisiibacteriota bacterium]
MISKNFRLTSPYSPAGDQPNAIKELLGNLQNNIPEQVLLGVTGSGKTFTMANVIASVNKPTLVIAHNKTLAAQLCAEFREFFPDNAVEYFVSYFDYYQPEAYVPQQDLFIEKDSKINDEIDRLRHSATRSLFSRKDVIVVASVSCIYGLGTPEDYLGAIKVYAVGQMQSRTKLLKDLVSIQYERNDLELSRGKFRIRGDVIEIAPTYEESIIRIEFFGDEIEKISELDPVTFNLRMVMPEVTIFPATHYVTLEGRLPEIVSNIRQELSERLDELKNENKLLEAQRLESRTHYDLEIIEETGFCKGIENYSRHLDGRKGGDPPKTLLDYFPADFLMIVDESHVTLPQIRGMFGGDYSRKRTLVDFGFRLPSAIDNRPLNFKEFMARINKVIYVSATPGPYELERVANGNKPFVVEQIIRPTGLVDPSIVIRPTKHQIDHIIDEIKLRVNLDERVLLVTLTKRMSEDLSEYLVEQGFKVRYMHSDIDTLERIEIIRDLRLGVFDVLVGINLLREGLDIPEVSMIAILDADKEGFLRNERSLIQIIGRAARNSNGKVFLYADKMTDSILRAVEETTRRRNIQIEHNLIHKITPVTVKKQIKDVYHKIKQEKTPEVLDIPAFIPPDMLPKVIGRLKKEMYNAADDLNFELAAKIRDKIESLKL